MAASQPPSPPPRIGRFQVLRELGRGAQATVWLAHDPRLDRDVALKVLAPAADPALVDAGLHEARAVARLMHPHIVPVFEADQQDGQAYMVFEYVPGLTLTEKLQRNPVMKAREAVELMLGVLDGLMAAHETGVVHRDLKPSNILVDAKGRGRLLDFGIADWMSDPNHRRRVVGTPGYLSPEAAQGFAPAPAMDVFAVAVMLCEMLSGRRLNYDPDPWRAVRRVVDEDLQMPDGLDRDVDDALRAIVQRGLARDPALRWPTARALHDALAEWLHPPVISQGGLADNGTLDFLLRRMRHRSDFPAMSESMTRIQRITSSENESLNSLSNEILKDVALTHKLLRLVNTVQYTHAGGGSISTVSRAAALIGFAGIRNLALSLILLERMENKAHARALREEFLRSLMAASLARELCPAERESEEAFLVGMLQNLGRLLTEFYFPEEAQQIQRFVRPERGQGAAATAPVSEAAASQQVLGLSFEQLGQGVARQWGLPDALQRGMSRPEGDAPTRLLDGGTERLRWLARAANDVTDVILHSEPAEAHAKVRHMGQRYARALGLSPERMDQAADQARQRLSQLAEAMEIRLPKSSQAQRLLAPLAPSADDDSLSPLELQATAIYEPTQVMAHESAARQPAAEVLAAGIHDVTNVMVENFKLNEVLRMILETIYRGLGFRSVVFCLRDPRSNALTGRFGLGDDVERVVPLFRVPLQLEPGQVSDLFTAICLKGSDTLIADAAQPRIAERLPGWFKGTMHGDSFLILPLVMKGSCFAMIYADRAGRGTLNVDEKELSLLRTLRNQAVMAFKQAG
ncbi:HDOD domain-containing protein [Pelomonas sp. APW6]|uniref:HDOD domain-containing protein n=1 Tax=Roseateles subflavus TaxID=3053353 RepID=A0ABT7LJ20_9BURK|nr:serine/threonine protein kinase [Pelomonas sp. APW6]MDL5032292.1 HDOD domain-containing protein [Pelomonas sp. APW6]